MTEVISNQLPDPPEEIFLDINEDPIKPCDTEYEYSVWYPHIRY